MEETRAFGSHFFGERGEEAFEEARDEAALLDDDEDDEEEDDELEDVDNSEDVDDTSSLIALEL